MNLLLLDPDKVGADGMASVSGAQAAHLLEVLKVTSGQSVRIGLVDGGIGTARVLSVDHQTVHLECLIGAPPARPRVDLLLALPRPKVLRRLWAQLAALGVGRILVTNAERVERNYFDTHVLTPECYRPLFIEGLQQARDTWVPRVTVHRQFRVLVEDELDELSDAPVRLVADPGSRATIARVLEGPQRRVLLAVGPEGGWNAFELALLERHGFSGVGMGPRTLRTDTACIALLAVVHEALGRA